LDQQDKSLLALQIANDAIATALASREKLSEPLEQEHAKRANPVNTPLLLEKKKIIQDKRAITDAKIKQASKITSAEIQSKKTILDKQKEQRDAKVKQLSSIKSPELRAKKDLISKKNVDNLAQIHQNVKQKSNASLKEPESNDSQTEHLDTRPRSADIEDEKLNHIEADLSEAQQNTDQHTLSPKGTLFL
jgi:hypothetical protein